jgi:hypothetical protein
MRAQIRAAKLGTYRQNALSVLRPHAKSGSFAEQVRQTVAWYRRRIELVQLA